MNKRGPTISYRNFPGSFFNLVESQLNNSNIISQREKITLFSNPLNENQLNINLGNFNAPTTIRLINSNGQTLIEHVANNKQLFQLDINLHSGIYLVQFINKQDTVVKKLVVEK